MVTIKTVKERIAGLVADLKNIGMEPMRVMLFGSYAKGTAHKDSDIDVAIWAKGFTGARALDIERIASIISRYALIQLHPLNAETTAKENPFIEEIERTGIDYSDLISK